MTTSHGVPLKDTGEREAAKTEQEAHMFECWNQPGGPGWELREKVDRLRLWVAGASVLGIIATLAGPVVLGWWLSTRLPSQPHRASESPVLINQAHAETTKGSQP